eukprot:gb/GECH01008156.1/.p1 GENE.gb/GECH01008156.1/~~gb/GECH01008156.1/.p1  ORF type:complete len:522 (+),score=88.47 gb/GECH01008156.1/:1-1566(+)
MDNSERNKSNEILEKIQLGFSYLHSEIYKTRGDLDLFSKKKKEHVQQSHHFYETAYFLNLQIHRQAEINSRYISLLKEILPQLTEEDQKSITNELESIFKVTDKDIEQRIKKQLQAPDPFKKDIILGRSVYHSRKRPHEESSHSDTPRAKKPRTEEHQNTNQDEDDDTAISVSLNTSNNADRISVNLEENENETSLVSDTVDNLEKPPTDNHHKLGSQSSQTEIPRGIESISNIPHNHSVSSVSFTPNSERLITGEKGSIKMWDINKLSSGPLFDVPCVPNSFIRSAQVTQDEQTMAVAGEFQEILLYDIANGSAKEKCRLKTNVDCHYTLALSPDSRYCFSATEGNSVAMWDLRTRNTFRSFEGHSNCVTSMDLSNNGDTLLTGSMDSSLRSWDCGSGKQTNVVNFASQIISLALCPQSTYVAVGLDNSVEVLDLNDSTSNYRLELHKKWVLALKYAHNGKWLLSGGRDCQLNLWRSPHGPVIMQQSEPNTILSMDISPDNQYIVTGSYSNQATVYSVVY